MVLTGPGLYVCAMTIRVGEHQRTVNPLMSGAVLKTLRHVSTGNHQDIADLSASHSNTLSESDHLRCLTVLCEQDWETIRSSARHLLDRPRDTAVDATLRSGDLKALLGLLTAMQLRFHTGHSTEFSFREDRVLVEHKALLSSNPAFAESVFVAAIHQVISEACVGETVPLHFQVGGQSVTPDRLLRKTARPLQATQWQLTIPTATLPRPTQKSLDHAEAVHTAVLLDPARAWRLSDLARSLDCSDRTLQRRLQQSNTTIRVLITGARLDVARGLVERTTLTLADIAAATGFTDHAHLTNRYQSTFGRSPSTDRERLDG